MNENSSWIYLWLSLGMIAILGFSIPLAIINWRDVQMAKLNYVEKIIVIGPPDMPSVCSIQTVWIPRDMSPTIENSTERGK